MFHLRTCRLLSSGDLDDLQTSGGSHTSSGWPHIPFYTKQMKLLNLTGRYFHLIALIDLSLEQLHKMRTYCLFCFLWDVLGFIDADVSDSL